MAPLRFVWQVGRFRGNLEERRPRAGGREIRAREYEKDGVKQKVFECRLESILKLDRAERRGENELEDRES